MPITVIMLDNQIIARKSSAPVKVTLRFIDKDNSAKIVKIKKEAIHALAMFLV